MDGILNGLTSAAWNIIPVMLILFLMGGILFMFYLKGKIEEIALYLKSIAISLEKISNRQHDE